MGVRSEMKWLYKCALLCFGVYMKKIGHPGENHFDFSSV